MELGERALGALMIESHGRQQSCEIALSGYACMLVPARVVLHHDVSVDVAERACALTIGVAAERAGRMPALQGRVAKGPHGVFRLGVAQKLTHRLEPQVVRRAAGYELRSLRRQACPSQFVDRLAGSCFARICPQERRHCTSPSLYRTTISYHDTTPDATIHSMPHKPTDEDYRRLLELRTGLRRFLRWSEQHARSAGLPPAQHQLLLAIRGHRDPRGPTVGDVADHLLLRHHSAVGLVDRAEASGLVRRRPDTDNQSVVRLQLTDKGSRQLEALSELHIEELAHLAPTMQALWQALERESDGSPRAFPHPAAPPGDPSAP